MQQPAGALRILGQQTARQPVEVLVDVRFLRIRDRRRLEIRALHEADGGSERHERLDVLRRAIEIRLQRDADAGRPRARAAEQIERRIDVRRALHVDPDEVVAGLRAIDEPLQMPKAELLVQIQPELRRLHRNLRAQAGGLNPVEHVEVVARDLLGLLDARQVLAEFGEEGADAPLLLRRGRRHGVLEPLAGHEGGHRPPDECRFCGAISQPGICGCCKEKLPGKAHTM